MVEEFNMYMFKSHMQIIYELLYQVSIYQKSKLFEAYKLLTSVCDVQYANLTSFILLMCNLGGIAHI